MVRHYKRKTEKLYSKEELFNAVEKVKKKELSSYEAAEKFKIPRSTIISYIYKTRGQKQLNAGSKTVFSDKVEREIASQLHILEKYGFPLTKKEVKTLVSEYVRRNGLVTPFKNGVPGEDWFHRFCKRNKLSLKKPQSVEIARKNACNPFTIYEYFDLLQNVTEELGLTDKPERIYNLDETSFCNDPSKSKVIGQRGYQSTRTTSSPGRDNTTVLLACNARGDKVPPLIIFQGKYLWNEWCYKNETVKTAYAVSQKGWMETSIFEKYFRSVFLPSIGTERPVLLVYDGHSTHLDLKVIEIAISENITILKLPPHSSHILQPLDCSAMKPMKDRWEDALVKWQRLHVGAKLPKHEFSRILTEIWDNLNPVILANGFRKTGIYPVNREVIPKEKFDPITWSKWEQYVFDRQQPSSNNDKNNSIEEILYENKTPNSSNKQLDFTVPTLMTLTLTVFNQKILTRDHDLQEINLKDTIEEQKIPAIRKDLNEIEKLEYDRAKKIDIKSEKSRKSNVTKKDRKGLEMNKKTILESKELRPSQKQNQYQKETKKVKILNNPKRQTRDDELQEINSKDTIKEQEIPAMIKELNEIGKQEYDRAKKIDITNEKSQNSKVTNNNRKGLEINKKIKVEGKKLTTYQKQKQVHNESSKDLIHIDEQNSGIKQRRDMQEITFPKNDNIILTSKLPLPKGKTTNTSNKIEILENQLIKPAHPEQTNKENEIYNMNVSFEELLLKSIARNDPPKNKKKRVRGAEILTYKEVVERMKNEQKDKKKKIQKPAKKVLHSKNMKTTKKKSLAKKKIYDTDSNSSCSYQSVNSSETEDPSTFFDNLLANESAFDENFETTFNFDIPEDILREIPTTSKETSAIACEAPFSPKKAPSLSKEAHVQTIPKEGDFVLAKFSSARGKKTYKYVCIIHDVSEDKIVVKGLKSHKRKDTFRIIEDDISIIDLADVVVYLPQPECLDGTLYRFQNNIEVVEL